MLPVASWWLIAGAAFLALEAFGVPGIGFLFAGLAAIAVGGAVSADIVDSDNLVVQFSLWFGMTAVIAALLWKPMQRWRVGAGSNQTFSNMIGSTATIVGAPLRKGQPGKAKWSGTTMVAELAADSEAEELAEGTLAEITEVRGTILILRSKQS